MKGGEKKDERSDDEDEEDEEDVKENEEKARERERTLMAEGSNATSTGGKADGIANGHLVGKENQALSTSAPNATMNGEVKKRK
ncbi:MAG: hypothetical protein L6R42_009625 [Xanthoria sp. 1 TBL-2021]|nr:MAG: hypothetical protein L6R42_009625 [Xanthoria sp. 1 TBL-2021]